jgi:hypothetical protein
MRFAVEWSREGHHRLGREWPRCLVHVWSRCCPKVLATTRFGSHLSRPSGWIFFLERVCFVSRLTIFLTGGGRRIRVLCQETIGDIVLGTELLRRVWQCRGDDECWWDFNVFIPSVPVSLHCYFFLTLMLALSLSLPDTNWSTSQFIFTFPTSGPKRGYEVWVAEFCVVIRGRLCLREELTLHDYFFCVRKCWKRSLICTQALLLLLFWFFWVLFGFICFQDFPLHTLIGSRFELVGRRQKSCLFFLSKCAIMQRSLRGTCLVIKCTYQKPILGERNALITFRRVHFQV